MSFLGFTEKGVWEGLWKLFVEFWKMEQVLENLGRLWSGSNICRNFLERRKGSFSLPCTSPGCT